MGDNKKRQTRSDGDQYKKDPRLDLGSGVQVKSGLQWVSSKGGNPMPDVELRATGVDRFRAASWNVGTLTGNSVEVAEELWRRGVVVGCLQETRWKGIKCRFIGKGEARYKVFWVGKKEGVGGVAIAVAEK